MWRHLIQAIGNQIALLMAHIATLFATARNEVILFTDTPWADTPSPANTPLGSACWDTINKRAVRILMECILV